MIYDSPDFFVAHLEQVKDFIKGVWIIAAEYLF